MLVVDGVIGQDDVVGAATQQSTRGGRVRGGRIRPGGWSPLVYRQLTTKRVVAAELLEVATDIVLSSHSNRLSTLRPLYG